MEIVYVEEGRHLAHHGILGQKWGKRNGPPYPLEGGDYSELEKKKIYRIRAIKPNSLYNKKHFDTVLKKGSTVSTLSHDPNRTKDTDYFFATHKFLDKHEYRAWFNKPIHNEEGEFLKYRINNKLNSDMKVAGEDSSIEAFKQLYKSDRDFFNYVTDPKRMQSLVMEKRWQYKGYQQTRETLNKIREGKDVTSKDVAKVYRMFNLTLPADSDNGDTASQRKKFFDKMKDLGYGAILDTNDAIYGGYKATSPIIVFDMEKVIPDEIRRITMNEHRVSVAIAAGRKILGV